MENPEKVVRIACTGLASAPLDDFQELQGELKTLSASDYDALKNEIIEMGFSFAPHCWHNEAKLYLLDGHQRTRALKKMREEGWQVPNLPYTLVEAEDMNQAKRKLLGAASQYGKTSEIGLLKFLSDAKIDPLLLASNFPLPKIDMPKFIETHFSQKSAEDSGDIGLSHSGDLVIPGDTVSASESTPTSHVRMVQVFLDDDTFPEFMDKATALQQHYGKENLSDTILEVLRADYQARIPNSN